MSFLFLCFFKKAELVLTWFRSFFFSMGGKHGATLCDFFSARGQGGEGDGKGKLWLKHEEEIFLPKYDF